MKTSILIFEIPTQVLKNIKKRGKFKFIYPIPSNLSKNKILEDKFRKYRKKR